MKYPRSSTYLFIILLTVACSRNDIRLVENDFHVSFQLIEIENKIEPGVYELFISASTKSRYAHLSVLHNNKRLVDNFPLPDSGRHDFKVLISIPDSEENLEFVSRDSEVIIHFATLVKSNVEIPEFKDITAIAGLKTESTWKYGGPTVADIDNDGDYDFILNDHHKFPPKLFWNNGDGTVSKEKGTFAHYDAHGTAAGDIDRDGDLDVILSIGGGNGTNPQPPVLHMNEDDKLVKYFREKGITNGSRGRSVRWVDMDLDGDLDLMIINAKSIDPNGGAQHLFYQNESAQFTRVRIQDLENENAERLLVTDLNNDHIDDIVLFSPLSLWLGDGAFGYKNVTTDWFQADLDDITAVAPLDLENDGDTDLYLSRGKPYYFIANKSLDFDPISGRLDLRDEGNKAVTSMEFEAEGEIDLSGHFLWYRLYDGGFPFHLGVEKDTISLGEEDTISITPEMAMGWPDDRTENGWYLGYLGEGNWQMEWVRNAPIFWGIRLSIDGVKSVEPSFHPQNRNVQDILLRNDGDKFSNVSADFNIPIGGNHQGVTVGDLNNDGLQDLLVFRFGFLRSRVSDWLLLNGGDQFSISIGHTMSDPEDTGHGDMGQAFDFNLDGNVDVLSGSDNPGFWYLYQNKNNDGNFLNIQIGYSPKERIDPISAVVEVVANGTSIKRRVESAGAVHSQSLLNIVHVGLGDTKLVDQITVTWRNGEKKELTDQNVNSLIQIGYQFN